jgi:hypothetical protein
MLPECAPAGEPICRQSDETRVQVLSIVMAGYGGGILGSHSLSGSAARRYGNAGHIVTLKLGGASVPKPVSIPDVPFPAPPPQLPQPSQRSGKS